MKIDVSITDTVTGEMVVYHDDVDYSSVDDARFFWTEGNFGCDCNRKASFERAKGIETEMEPDEEYPCSGATNRYTISIHEIA